MPIILTVIIYRGDKIAPLLNLLVNLCIIGIGIKTGSYKYPAKSEWNKVN